MIKLEAMSSRLRHLVIPHTALHIRAQVLRHGALLFYALVLFLFQFYIYKAGPSILGFATDIKSSQIISITNQKRSQAGLSALAGSSKLEQAAFNKAKDMFQKDYWAHYAPDGSTTPWMFILDSGYKYKYAGENLAKGFDTSTAVVEAWMVSSSHRDNLLSKNYTDIGVAVVNGVLLDEETTLVVQMFGAPLQTVAQAPPAQSPPSQVGAEGGSPPTEQTGPQQTQEEEIVPVELIGPQQHSPTPADAAAVSNQAPLKLSSPSTVERVFKYFNPVSSPKTLPLSFGFVLMGLFALDEMIIIRRGLFKRENLRQAGENFAHIAILALMVGAIWYAKVGAVG